MTIDDARKSLRITWLKVALRLQKEADFCNSGYSVLTMRVLVNEKGDAVSWTPPQVSKIEPKSSNFEDVLTQILGEVSNGS